MIPVEKVRDLISRHGILERELSSEDIDKNKFAEMSKKYSDLNEIII
jgi:peptide chain release factor 1